MPMCLIILKTYDQQFTLTAKKKSLRIVFKWDLKEASEGAGSRQFHTDGTAVEKAHDAKDEPRTEERMMTGVVWPGSLGNCVPAM